MSAKLDKFVIVGAVTFVCGFVCGAGGLIWILNRDDKDLPKNKSVSKELSGDSPIDENSTIVN